jgi:hypothetical protein
MHAEWGIPTMKPSAVVAVPIPTVTAAATSSFKSAALPQIRRCSIRLIAAASTDGKGVPVVANLTQQMHKALL